MWMANLTIHPGCHICHSVGSTRMMGTFYFRGLRACPPPLLFLSCFYDGISIVNFYHVNL